jgi:hypothetical protein
MKEEGMFDHTDNVVPFNSWPMPAAATAGVTSRKRRAATEFLDASPSRRIELALADLECIEQSAGYAIDMRTWHAPDPVLGICTVCLAGAVLANRHPIRPDQVYVGPFDAEGPGEFATSPHWDRILCSIDELRNGFVDGFLVEDGRVCDTAIEAFVTAHGPNDLCDPFPDYVEYDIDTAAFKTWARDIAGKLAAAGH